VAHRVANSPHCQWPDNGRQAGEEENDSRDGAML
jgi:hypothetical protein